MNKLEVTGWFEWHLLFKKIVFLKVGLGLTFNVLELKINIKFEHNVVGPSFYVPLSVS